jgi:hypothetical protein
VKNAKYRAERVFSSLYGAVKELIPQGNHYIVRGYFPMYGNTMEIGYKLAIGYTTLNVKLWLYDWFSVIEFPRREEFQWPILPGLPYLKAPNKTLIVLEEDGNEWPAYIDIDSAYIAALKYTTSARYRPFHERTVKRQDDTDFRYDLLDKNPPHDPIEMLSWRVEDIPGNIKDLAFKPLLVE